MPTKVEGMLDFNKSSGLTWTRAEFTALCTTSTQNGITTVSALVKNYLDPWDGHMPEGWIFKDKPLTSVGVELLAGFHCYEDVFALNRLTLGGEIKKSIKTHILRCIYIIFCTYYVYKTLFLSRHNMLKKTFLLRKHLPCQINLLLTNTHNPASFIMAVCASLVQDFGSGSEDSMQRPDNIGLEVR